MKKRILSLMLAATMMFSATACCSDTVAMNKGSEVEPETQVSRFVEIENTGDWRVVYDRYEKVMYGVSNEGEFTVLVDEYDYPVLWEEE